MTGSPVFELAATELERTTGLDRLEARGTIRLALRKAFFDPRSVDVAQMVMVVERILPQELATRGVDDHGSICQQVAIGLKSSHLATSGVQSPDAIFDRLIRR